MSRGIMNTNNKKKEQLGMNHSTASARLLKDILWKLILETGKNICFQCKKEMCRNTFSIEHKIPWLDSENPKELFFDIENISFSHLTCNIKAARQTRKYQCREEARNKRLESSRKWKENNRVYDSEERKDRYRRIGS